jgi:hypothetical protein
MLQMAVLDALWKTCRCCVSRLRGRLYDRDGRYDVRSGTVMAAAWPKRCRNRAKGCPDRCAEREGADVTAHQREVPAAGRDAVVVRCIPCVRAHTLDNRAGIDR